MDLSDPLAPVEIQRLALKDTGPTFQFVVRINGDGSLTKIDEFGGPPQIVNGDQGSIDFDFDGSPAGIDAT